MLNSKQKEIFNRAKEFGITKVFPLMRELPDTAEATKEMYKLAIDNGFCGLNVPKELGGKGYTYLETALTYEGLAYGDGLFSFEVQLHNNITLLINRLTEDQHFKDLVTQMARGEKITAFALTEESAGSDPGSNKGYALRREDGYHIFANKRWIGNAHIADYIVLFAKKETEKGMYMLLVDRNLPGIEVNKMPDLLAGNASSFAAIDFNDCVVPSNMLITERGYQEALASIDVARTYVPAICVGMAQRAVDLSIEYLKNRISMKQPVINSQAIQWQLAELDAKIEAARQLVYRTAEGMDANEPIAIMAAKNKLFAPAVAMEALTMCVQLHGAKGLQRNEYPARNLVTAKLCSIMDGSSEIQKFIIGRDLVK